ncbi:MAG: phosphodiester glycosidase family protein [Planctomycetota bacterium]
MAKTSVWSAIARFVVAAALAIVATDAYSAVVRSSEPFIGVKHHQIVQRPGLDAEPDLPGFFAAQLFEIEMDAPGLDFFLSPPADPNGDPPPPGPTWTVAQTTRDFVDSVGAQIGINGDFYGTSGIFRQPIYTNLSDGTRYGLSFSGSFLNVTDDNRAGIWSAESEMLDAGDNYWNAIGGNQRILTDGQVTAPLNSSYTTTLNPHTAIGISEDRGRVFLLTVDGRQSGYSNGIRTDDMARLLHWFGAHDAINLDGGGSTTMVMDDSDDGTPNARLLNIPSDGGGGTERLVANSLAVFATPNPEYVPLVSIQGPWGEARPTFDRRSTLANFEADTSDFIQFSLASDGVDNGQGSLGLSSETSYSGTTSLALNLTAGDNTRAWTHAAIDTNDLSDPDDLDRLALPPTGQIGTWVRVVPDEGEDADRDLFVWLSVWDGTPLLGDPLETTVIPVPADGEWHAVAWSLEATSGTPFVTGPNVLLESLNIASSPSRFGRQRSPWSGRVYVDQLAYAPEGTPLNPVIPEPVVAIGFLTAVFRRCTRA